MPTGVTPHTSRLQLPPQLAAAEAAKLVETVGIEPTTPCLQGRRSPTELCPHGAWAVPRDRHHEEQPRRLLRYLLTGLARWAVAPSHRPHAPSAGRRPENWLRGTDSNRRPPGYEPSALPDCATPHQVSGDAPDRPVFHRLAGRGARSSAVSRALYHCSLRHPCYQGAAGDAGPTLSRVAPGPRISPPSSPLALGRAVDLHRLSMP